MKKHILRLPEVALYTGLSKSSIYKKMGEKSFPRRIRLSSRAVGWLESDILEWLQDRIEKSLEDSILGGDYND